MKNFYQMIFVFCLIINQISFAKDPMLIVVEGNIGVGKSTFVNILSSYFPNATTVLEACNEWQNISGYNLLDAFYKDTNRWACTMELYVLMTGLRKLQKAINVNCNLYITESSIYTSKYCFAQNLKSVGMLNDLEWALFNDFWNWCYAQTIKPSLIIYLQADPEICYERIKKRARSEESIIPLQYLQQLHKLRDEWLVEKKYEDFENVPVITLDASLNFRDDIEIQKRFVGQILDFLSNQENTVVTK